jgi:hypothetical protein
MSVERLAQERVGMSEPRGVAQMGVALETGRGPRQSEAVHHRRVGGEQLAGEHGLAGVGRGDVP